MKVKAKVGKNQLWRSVRKCRHLYVRLACNDTVPIPVCHIGGVLSSWPL